MENKEHTICIFETTEYFNEWEDITRHIPVGEFRTVTEDEYKLIVEYVSWNNRQRNGIHLTLVHLSNIRTWNWEQFNKDMEEARKKIAQEEEKKRIAAEKRKAQAAARKLKKQMKDEESEKALLAELLKKHGEPS